MASIEKEHNQKIACLKGQWYVVEKKWQRFKKIREVDFESEMNCTIGCPMPVTDLKYWQPHPALSKPAGEKILRFEVDGVAYQPPYSKALAACNCGADQSNEGGYPVCSEDISTTSVEVECKCEYADLDPSVKNCMWRQRKGHMWGPMSKLRVEHEWGQTLPNEFNPATSKCTSGAPDGWSEWSACPRYGGVRKRTRVCVGLDETGEPVVVNAANCGAHEVIEWERCGTPSKWPEATKVRARSHWDFPLGTQAFVYSMDHPQAAKPVDHVKSNSIAAVIDGLSATTEPKCNDFKGDSTGLYYSDQNDLDYYDTYENYWWRCASYACTYGTGEDGSGRGRGDYFRFDLGERADIGGLGVDVGNLLSVIGVNDGMHFHVRLIVTKEAKGTTYPDESFKGYTDCGYMHERELITWSNEMFETPRFHFSCPDGTKGQYLWLIQDHAGYRFCIEEAHLFSSLE